MSRVLTYVEAIRDTLDQAMAMDNSIIVMGLGATYAQGCDGTTAGLVEKYPGRVFDTPCSENATTGFCTGAGMAGLRPVIYHGRVEFALFAFDQIVTQAAKWHYMFGSPISAVYRIAVGRRWGDAPQHTQVLHSVFAHVPGLKVVIPSTPRMAKMLLVAAIFNDNPTIFLEHRWLYGIKQTVPEDWERLYACRLDRSEVVKEGTDITIVANSDTLLEALRCVKPLQEAGISPEIIDIVTINPVDYCTILASVRKTGRLMVLDVGTKAFGIGSEIAARACEHIETFYCLKDPPVIIGAADCPCPMSTALVESYYPTAGTIIENIKRIPSFMKTKIKYVQNRSFRRLHIPPDDNIDEFYKEIP